MKETMNTAQFDISRYLNIRGVEGVSWLPSGEEIVFQSSLTGTSQVWKLSGPGAWPEQLTFFDNSVGKVKLSPVEDLMVFGMDQGGDERTQLYLLSGDGSEIKPLTDDPEIMHFLGNWSRDGRRIAYAANHPDTTEYRLCIQDVHSGEVETIYRDDVWIDPVMWSPDDRFIWFQKKHSALDIDFFLADTETGEIINLTPHEPPVRHWTQGSAWSADGSRIYLTTDGGGRDFLTPAFIDIETRKLEYLEEVSWDVESVNLSPDGRLIMLRFNENGFTRLDLREIATGKQLPVPPFPRGMYAGAFSPDSRKLAMVFNSPTRNSDLWMYDLEDEDLTQWTFSATAGVPAASFVDAEPIEYESFDGLKIPAYAYYPKDTDRRQLPVVIDIHGGPEYQSTPAFNGEYQYFAKLGYMVLVPNIRGSLGYGKRYSHLDDVRLRFDSIKDVAYAANWLTDSGIGDPRRIAVKGSSYGGFMTLACLAHHPDLWAAGVDTVGLSNFLTFLKNTGAYRRKHRSAEYGDPEKDADFLLDISPITHVDKITAPLMGIQGANDPRVPQSESEQMVDAIRSRGGIVEYLLFEDEGHGVGKLKNKLTVLRVMTEFLDKHVMNRDS